MNKPRLIDANKLYKLIEENSYTLVDRINSKDKGMFLIGIKQAIDMQPTAYDIDEVIKKLESNSWKSPKEPHKLMWLDRAIEIVKGGADNA